MDIYIATVHFVRLDDALVAVVGLVRIGLVVVGENLGSAAGRRSLGDNRRQLRIFFLLCLFDPEIEKKGGKEKRNKKVSKIWRIILVGMKRTQYQ